MTAKNSILTILVLLVTGPIICSQDKVEKMDHLLSAYCQNGQFNGVVLVAEKDSIIYRKAFGLADRELNVPVSVDSKFKIASLSKPFTALAVLKLVQEGKLSLNGTIKEYIPDYSGKLGDNITIHQLLNHTSGIRSNMEPEEELIRQRLHHDLRDMIKFRNNQLDADWDT